jgi:hypothetical protein
LICLILEQKKQGYKQKQRQLKQLESGQRKLLLWKPNERGSLREKLHDKHCYR